MRRRSWPSSTAATPQPSCDAASWRPLGRRRRASATTCSGASSMCSLQSARRPPMPKASQERRERAANEMRRTILDAAEHLLIEGGPDEVTIRKIASLLDYAPPSLYYYVADKEAVLAALADRHGTQVAQAMQQAV